MVVNLRLPNQRACHRIYGVGIGAHITKEDGKLVAAGDRSKTDSGSNNRLRFERPAGASAFCVQSVHLTIAAPDKHETADNGWLGQCAGYTKKSERPFQLQLGHLVQGQSGHCCWLKAAVANLGSPSIPLGTIEPLGKPNWLLCALPGNLGRGGRGFRGFRTYEGCDCRPFGTRTVLCDGCHAPGAERSYYLLERHRPEDAYAWRTSVGVIVTLGAV